MFIDDLPDYTGPYKVACRDVEYIKYLSTQQEPSKEENGLQPASLLVKLFYPAEVDEQTRQKARWAPYPAHNYYLGLLEYKKLSRFISVPVAYLFGSNARIGAYSGDGSDLIKTERPLPVAIFSHGLAGSRNGYSGLCGELASHGIVVCAIEHRDGTAVYSYGTAAPHDFPQRFAPGQENSPENLKFYRDRIQFRVQEVDQAYELLKNLNDGITLKEHYAPGNVNCPDYTHFEKKDLWENGLNAFKGRLKIKETLAIGHSFGGATMLEALSRSNSYFKAGVVFDPWMYPIAGHPILKSSLIVNTQNFTNWSINFDKVKSLLEKSKKSNDVLNATLATPNLFQIVTLPDAQHIHQSDIPSLLSRLSSYVLKSTLDPTLTLRRNAYAALSFIKRNLDSHLPSPLPLNADILDPSSPEHASFIFHSS